jgi:surface carbohydrate biosynthesis protein
MNRPKIALMVDHPQRDLAGLVLTAFELAQHGAVCYLVPSILRRSEIWSLRPDLVMLFFLRRSYERFARHFLQAGIQFGLLDSEGGVWPDFESYTELLWDDRALFREARPVCMWGPKLAEHMIEQEYFSRDQVLVTGSPRFDFYHPMWRSVLQEDSAANGNMNGNGNTNGSYRQRILVNTNFSVVNPRFGSPEASIKYHQELGWSKDRAETFTAMEKQAINATIDMVRNLARDFPQTQIVLRPHPFEGPDIYRKNLSGLNVEFNLTGPVLPQIQHASVVIQRSCTTGIEAGLASVPTISPQWIPAPYLMPTVESVSLPSDSYSDLRAKLDVILDPKHVPVAETNRTIDRVIGDWFHRIDGTSYKRVSQAVLAALDGPRVVNEELCSRYLYRLDSSERFGGITRRMRRLLKLHPDWSLFSARREPAQDWTKGSQYFGVSEVRGLAERISHSLVSRGCHPQPVDVELARDRKDVSTRHFGFSVTISCRE